MRYLRWALAGPLALALTTTVNAQTYSLADDSPIKPVVFSEDCATCDDGCTAAPDCGCDVTPDCGCDDGCTSACGSCGGGDLLGCCDLGEPFALFGTHECSGITVGGWVQAGYTTYNTGMFNNHPYTVDLNQTWLYAEKAVDNGGCGFDWGFRFDYMYGSDGPDTQAFGNRPNVWDEGWDHGAFYGHAIPQAYIEMAYNDLSVKMGHFYTIAGYEVVTAPDNFFYSHAFTMFNSEPFTHTGVLATYGLSDNIEVYGGWTAGWDTGFDRNGGSTFLGGASLTLTEDITLIYTTTAGRIGFGTNQTGYSHTVVADVTLTDNLNYVFQSDLVSYTTNKSVGINQYLFYNINDCLAVGGRFEWWQSKALNNNSDLYELTFGLNYRPHANMVIRPEIRWDKDDDGILIPAAHNDQAGFGIDAIVTF